LAYSPLSNDRQAIITSAPFATNALAVSKPKPLFPPVTIATLPVRLGISFFVHLHIFTEDIFSANLLSYGRKQNNKWLPVNIATPWPVCRVKLFVL
jgi:hypothetical protein